MQYKKKKRIFLQLNMHFFFYWFLLSDPVFLLNLKNRTIWKPYCFIHLHKPNDSRYLSYTVQRMHENDRMNESTSYRKLYNIKK